MNIHENTHLTCLIFFVFILFFCFPFSSSSSSKSKFIKPNEIKSNVIKQCKPSTFLVFGDSTVDAGNNNYIKTAFRGNFRPYGMDFNNAIPTGRFSNGRLISDFISSYIGLKDEIGAYLDPNIGIEEMMSGVSFASGGSGFDPLTPLIGNVKDLPSQVEDFKEYKRKIEEKIGKIKMEKHIEEAVFILSAGTNDYVINYLALPIRKSFTPKAYQDFIIQNLKQFLESLWEEGARKIIVAGLPPMGCLPLLITFFSNEALTSRRCIDRFTTLATNYNSNLQEELNNMQMIRASLGSKIFYADIFNPILDIIQDPKKYGFDEVKKGCCGSGYLEASFICNPKSFMCSNTSSYVFFDSIHPTEKAYFDIFNSIRPTIDAIISC